MFTFWKTLYRCSWVVTLLLLPSPVLGQVEVAGVGSDAQGADIAITNLDQDARPEMILMAYDNPPRANIFRYKIGWNVNSSGSAENWGSVVEVSGMGWEAQGAGVGVFNIDSNSRPDMVLMAYDNPAGPNSFRYKIGWNLNSSGTTSSWSQMIDVRGVGNEASGASMAFANLDNNPRPDMILMAYDNPAQANTFRYRIGWNIDEGGKAVRWSDPIIVSGVGWEAQGAGVTVANLDANKQPEMILMAYDNPAEANTFRYKIGRNLDAAGVAESWDDVKHEPGVGWEAQGAGVDIFSLDGQLKLVLMAYDSPKGENSFRYNLIALAGASPVAVTGDETEGRLSPGRDEAVDRESRVDIEERHATALPARLSQRLTSIGIANPNELIAQVQTRESLKTLAKKNRMSTEELVRTAQEAELISLIGSIEASPDEIELLRVMDLERPEDFLTYAGREEILEALAARWAGRLGLTPPPPGRTAEWMTAVKGKMSQIPSLKTLIPETVTQRVPPSPQRTVSLVEGLQQVKMIEADNVRKHIVEPSISKMVLAVLPIPVTIAANQKTFHHDFNVSEPGLFRADITLKRPNGSATLKWFIEIPGAGTILTGNQDLMVSVGVTKYAYFWVPENVIPADNVLRLRLDVIENVSEKVEKTDPIEGTIYTTDPTPGPINGTISIQQIPPVQAKIGKTLRLNFYDEKNPGKSRPPIAPVEIVLQTPADAGKGESAWELDVELVGFPRPKLLKAPSGATYFREHDFNLWNKIDIRRDGQPVSCTLWDGQGWGGAPIAGKLFCQEPESGTYTFLISHRQCFDFQTLTTKGYVFDGSDHHVGSGPHDVNYVDVTVRTKGGELPMSYVLELTALEVNGQNEPDYDDDDADDGEFTVNMSAFAINTPGAAGTFEDAGAAIYAGTKPDRIKGRWPTPWTTAWIPKEKGGLGRHITYPRWPLVYWADDVWKKYDHMGISVSVVEEDRPTDWQTFWADVQHAMESIVPVAKLCAAIWKLDFEGAATKAVELTKIKTTWPPTEYDDIMGTAAYSWTKAEVASALGPGSSKEFIFIEPEGPEDINVVYDHKASSCGWETKYAQGYGGRWIKTHLRMRRVPSFWARAGARLLSFTLSQDLDDPPNPTDVVVHKYPPQHECTSHGFFRHEGYSYWQKHTWNEDFTVQRGGPDDPKILKYPARAGKPITAEADTPPSDVAKTGPIQEHSNSPFFYIEWEFEDEDPGADANIYRFSRTFYVIDFVNNATKKGDWRVLDGGRTKVNYYKDGPIHVGHFILKDPGGYLQRLEMKVYVRVWQG